VIQIYGHHHPDFQADTAEAIVSKSRTRTLPRNVVPMPKARKMNTPTTPHRNPTDMSETKVNKGRQS
jgi:hypothetical protein